MQPAIRVEPLELTSDLSDFRDWRVSTPEYELLLRLEHERRVHLDLGLEREASGIGFAMLTIWQLAISRPFRMEIELDVDLTRLAAA